jgi:hypothetical protein
MALETMADHNDRMFATLEPQAMDGTLARYASREQIQWGWRNDHPMADHRGLTLLHVSARAGHLPENLLNDDEYMWEWQAYDGWTVREAYQEYLDAKFGV